MAAKEAYKKGIDESQYKIEEAQREAKVAEKRLAAADEAVNALQRQLAARSSESPSKGTVTREVAENAASAAAMVVAEEAKIAAEEAAEEAVEQMEAKVCAELEELEVMLEKIAEVAPTVGNAARAAVTAAKEGGSVGSSSSTDKAPAGGKGKGAAAAAAATTPDESEEAEEARAKLSELAAQLVNVKTQLAAREAEVSTLKTSLKAARTAANAQRGKGGKPPVQRRPSGGFDLGAMFGQGEEPVTTAADLELSELEATLTQVESTLLKKGVWSAPPADSSLKSTTLTKSISSPGRLPTRRESKNLWENLMSAFQGEEGQSQSSPSSSPSSSRTPGGSVKANPKDATAVLGLDLPAEKRKEEAKLTELSTSSRTLMAQAKERQKATRKAADKLAEELKKARVEGGEAQRSLTVKLGEAELEVQTLKRYLREAESVGGGGGASPGLSSPAGAVKVGASALTPGSLAAASMSFPPQAGVPLGGAAGLMSGAGAAALERARARAPPPAPAMDDWATDEEEDEVEATYSEEQAASQATYSEEEEDGDERMMVRARARVASLAKTWLSSSRIG